MTNKLLKHFWKYFVTKTKVHHYFRVSYFITQTFKFFICFNGFYGDAGNFS